jgi:ubiquinone/menaquinone biosynthesis C-methylase UbiE
VSQSVDYVHGYSAREGIRLADQAAALAGLLHAGTSYPRGSRVLEAGCGTGAQTVILAGRSPDAEFSSMDVSELSLADAQRRVRRAGYQNVRFLQADIFRLPFEPSSFDHVFVCFVLEHLTDPPSALKALMTVLKPGGSLTVIEGDHGSAYFHPASENARRAIQCLIDLQHQAGGDSLIGRRLYPLLAQARYRDVQVTPLVAYADGSRPDLADAITLKTFTAMVEGVADQAVGEGLIDAATWSAGIRDLRRTADHNGTFCYTFFKAVARR